MQFFKNITCFDYFITSNPYRTPRGDSDHRDPGGNAPARFEQGTGESTRDQLFEQYAAAGNVPGAVQR